MKDLFQCSKCFSLDRNTWIRCFFNRLGYPTMAVKSLKFCGTVAAPSRQLLNEVELCWSLRTGGSIWASKWYITFHVGDIGIWLSCYLRTYLWSPCIHYNDLHYVLIRCVTSGWFCIRKVLGLNLGQNTDCLEFFFPWRLSVPTGRWNLVSSRSLLTHVPVVTIIIIRCYKFLAAFR